MRKRRVAKGGELPRKIYGYVRVSTDKQATEGVSLAAQEEKLRAFALATGRVLDDVLVDDGESAKSFDRPNIQRVLTELRAGRVAAIVVMKLDRLTRSVRDLGDLLELCARHDVALVSVSESLDTSTAAGRMVVHMLGVVAQWEREAIAERTTSSLAHKRKNRAVYSPTPFGFAREGTRLVPIPAEQAALARAKQLDVEGVSFRAIGRMLMAADVRPKRGTTWHASSVRAMLRSKIANEEPAR